MGLPTVTIRSMAGEHGTIATYQGSRTREPCRCAKCKAAHTNYQRNRRGRVAAERTKTRVTRAPADNVVPINSTTPAAPAMGGNEAGLRARFEQLGIEDIALMERCLTLARLIDNPGENVSLVVPAVKQLDLMLVRCEPPAKRRKGNAGRLEIIQRMAAKNDRSRLDVMNSMGHKQTGTQ
jgi:hypothetical protein